MKDYKRLTKRGNLGHRTDYYSDNDYYHEKRLQELEDKIENGTLIELPCKVGDIRFLVDKNIKAIKELKVSMITQKSNGDWVVRIQERSGNSWYCGYSWDIQFFVDISFELREQAEQKVKELRSKK